jgi:hypothetical protein
MPNTLANTKKRLLQGTIARFVDGKWADSTGGALPGTLVALGTTEALQCWSDGKPTDTITEHPLPKVEDLNAQIPEAEWEAGPDGKPRAPWVHQYVAYLFDPVSAETYTYLNSTFGAKIAVQRLAERVETMQRLRGDNALPIVKLESKPMKTKFGTKQRPEFTITEWRRFGTNGGDEIKAIEHKPLGKSIAPPTVSEELDDAIPTFGA